MAEIDRWALERACWARGIALVCGCDEAGAGPLAGAVYAGAVILPPECSIEGLNDSKQVTPKRRDALYDTIRTVAVAWAVARVEAEEIDATDILSARIKAMQMAIDRLEPAPGFALNARISDVYGSSFMIIGRKMTRNTSRAMITTPIMASLWAVNFRSTSR